MSSSSALQKVKHEPIAPLVGSIPRSARDTLPDGESLQEPADDEPEKVRAFSRFSGHLGSAIARTRWMKSFATPCHGRGVGMTLEEAA